MHRIQAKHVIQPGALHKLRRDTQTTGLHGFLHGGMFGLCHQQAFTDTLRVGQRRSDRVRAEQPQPTA
jgi:hypothetical protein